MTLTLCHMTAIHNNYSLYSFTITYRILDSLERFTDAVPIPDNATQREVTFTRDNFAIIVQELDVNSFNGEAFRSVQWMLKEQVGLRVPTP